MHAKTVRDLGAFVRSQRREQGLTQAELAGLLGVSRDWVVRLEQGHPRLEAQRVLDALVVLGVTVDLGVSGSPGHTPGPPGGATSSAPGQRAHSPRPGTATSKNERSAVTEEFSARGQGEAEDPFAYLTEGR